MAIKPFVLLFLMVMRFAACAESSSSNLSDHPKQSFPEALSEIVNDEKIKKNICSCYRACFSEGSDAISSDPDTIKKCICPHKNNMSAEYMFLLGLSIKKLNNKFRQETSSTMVYVFERIVNDQAVVKKINAFVHKIYAELWNDYDKRVIIKKLLKVILLELFDQASPQKYLVPCVLVGG